MHRNLDFHALVSCPAWEDPSTSVTVPFAKKDMGIWQKQRQPNRSRLIGGRRFIAKVCFTVLAELGFSMRLKVISHYDIKIHLVDNRSGG
jgi:hypothetical protein